MSYIRTNGNSFEIRNDMEPQWKAGRAHQPWPWKLMKPPRGGVYDHTVVSPASRHDHAKRAARAYAKRHGWQFQFELDEKDPSRLLVFRVG